MRYFSKRQPRPVSTHSAQGHMELSFSIGSDPDVISRAQSSLSEQLSPSLPIWAGAVKSAVSTVKSQLDKPISNPTSPAPLDMYFTLVTSVSASIKWGFSRTFFRQAWWRPRAVHTAQCLVPAGTHSLLVSPSVLFWSLLSSRFVGGLHQPHAPMWWGRTRL